MLWKDLRESIAEAKHLVFIIVQNGEVNNVYIKTIEMETPRIPDKAKGIPADKAGQKAVRALHSNAQGVQRDMPEADLHQDLQESALGDAEKPDWTYRGRDNERADSSKEVREEIKKGREEYKKTGGVPYEEEVPEEMPKTVRTTSLEDEVDAVLPLPTLPKTEETPPQTPEIVPNPPKGAVKTGSDTPGAKQASPDDVKPGAGPVDRVPPPQADSGTEVQAGHRVKAIYENQEVKGEVKSVLKTSGQPDEYIVVLDSGRKVILGEREENDGVRTGDGLESLLVNEE